MLSAGQGVCRRGAASVSPTCTAPRWQGLLLFISFFITIVLPPQGTAWPYDYRYLYDHCPGPEWSVMCRGCCEYDLIRCKCPVHGAPVGYAVPCCRNAINECDPCIIHPGCSIFENCKRCNNGTWGPRDDFFIRGKYCAECRPGWSGGDCLQCGGVIHKRQGHLVLESYPTNARCEWTLKVDRPFTIDFRFMMLSLEFDHSCRYDYIEVRDGDSVHSRVIGRFCGNNRPALIQSTGNSLHVLFVSDGYKNFDGFFATFQESSACSSSPCLHDGTCVLDTSFSYHCACLSGYTGKRCENVIGCRRPPVPHNGSTQGVFHHSGARVTFHCDLGFELRGIRSSICLQDGTWSAPAPECAPVERFCALPPKPDHGDHFLVYGPNDVLIALQYLCYRPYRLTGSSQRTCLSNNTWSGTPATCSSVNNTLDKSGKDKEVEKVPESSKETETVGDGDLEKPESRANATEGRREEPGKETERPTNSTDTSVNVLEETQEGGTDKVQPEDRRTAPARPGGGGRGRPEDTDNSLNTVERKDGDGPKPRGRAEGKDGNDGIQEIDGKSTEVTEIVVIKDKGQEEKQRKEEQVGEDGGRPGKVGPNDTKFTKPTEASEPGGVDGAAAKPTGNRTRAEKRNETSSSPERGKPTAAGRGNATRVTLYRAADGEAEKTAGGKPATEDAKKSQDGRTEEERAGKEAAEKRREEEEKERNQSIDERSCPPPPRLHHGFHKLLPGLAPETLEFFCNHSYALSGDALRTCQKNGTWSGKAPLCVRACRAPKVSELVKQKVLPPQIPSRKTPVHKLYSMGLGRHFQADDPRESPPALPRGFHHLYTHIEYECASPFYHHSGSARRTCLKTGKWSGRHVSCSPVCGKHSTFDPRRPAEAHWPWLAAVYRRSGGAAGVGSKGNKAESLAAGTSVKKGKGAGAGGQESASDWQLVCSGALVNQRSVVVAAHCVTELGKTYPLGTAKTMVVVGKQHRDDLLSPRGLQRLRVASIVVHPNYDPLILDSDLALIKLLDKARIGEQVLPICLPGSQGGEAASRRGLVTGWSPLPDPALGTDERARVGVVRLTDVVPCEQQYARNGVPVSVSDNMLCGSHKPDYGESNICPSDTGGVLVLPAEAVGAGRDSLGPTGRARETQWRLMGLVSFGYEQGECDPELYTVYTHVANFKDWIESHMQ